MIDRLLQIEIRKPVKAVHHLLVSGSGIKVRSHPWWSWSFGLATAERQQVLLAPRLPRRAVQGAGRTLLRTAGP